MKNIIATIRTLFGMDATIAKAISGITKAVTQLDEIAKREDAAIDDSLATMAAAKVHYDVEMEFARNTIRDATGRQIKAERIKERLEALIGA
jgi:hypothetical protein